MTSKEITNEQVSDFCRNFVPFGYLDIQTAIDTAQKAGYSLDWAAEQVNEFINSTDSPIDEVDPCYCVYDSILQEARTEIDELTGYDFCNDLSTNTTEIYTAANFMATSYDYSQAAVDELTEKLKEVDRSELSEATQWFLNEITA
jgi:D-mannonate dehydratase